MIGTGAGIAKKMQKKLEIPVPVHTITVTDTGISTVPYLIILRIFPRLFQCKDAQSKKEWLASYEEARNLQKESANSKVPVPHLFSKSV
jgi:hypothetical protein